MPAHRRPWTRPCTAIAARRPPSISRCTILSAALPGSRSTRCSAPNGAAALPILAVIGSTDEAADLREARGALGRGLSRLQDQGRARRARGGRARARGDLPGAQGAAARSVWSPPTPIRALMSRRRIRYVAEARRLRSRFLRAAGARARSRRHGARRRRKPRPDRRRRGHSFARRHRAPSRAQGGGGREPEGDQARRFARHGSRPAGCATGSA